MGAFVGTINKIEEVGLERLVFAYVKNFKSLVPRESHYVGEPVIFIEPDSVLPDESWAETYKKYAPKRVKPIKLRGFLTEGIILGIKDIPSDLLATGVQEGGYVDGDDVSFLLGITKYEPPLPVEENAVGGLPYWLSKTDEIRWEHLPLEAVVGSKRLITLKIDGSSCTFVIYRGEGMAIHVYSRSLEYEDDGSTRYSQVLDKELQCGIKLRDELADEANEFFMSDENTEAVVFRGELYGANIQKRGMNPHASEPLSWACYHTYVYNNAELIEQPLTKLFCESAGVEIVVPCMYLNVDEEFINGIMDGAALRIAPEAYEGVVINFPPYYYRGRMVSSCKVINKVYDSKI